MIKILAIGNSFSQDATAYLHDIAKSGGIETKVVNLYIGGCSLEMHHENIRNNSRSYSYELNGVTTGDMVSIKDALTEDTWDFVTMQQASHDSGIIETYYPHINELYEYVNKYSENSEKLIHETWAYEVDSNHDAFPIYDCSQEKMYSSLSGCYKKVLSDLNLRMIPCGDIIQKIRKTEPLFSYSHDKTKQSLCRDGFHMNIPYGRYLTAAVWYKFVLNGDLNSNSFTPSNEADDNLFNEKITTIKKVIAFYESL